MTAAVIKVSGDRWLFFCPGCVCAHFVDARWTVSGGEEEPTISPSVLVYPSLGQPRCHSFVVAGFIRFLGDSTHALAGKTVPLPPWGEVPGGYRA